MLGALEMLRRGITCVHDDAYHVPVASRDGIDAIMQAYADAGIRATVAIDQPNVVEYDKYPFLAESAQPAAARCDGCRAAPGHRRNCWRCTAHLIARWHGAADGRLAAAVSCSAPQRVTTDYLAGLSALSRAHDLPFNVHVLETRLQRVLGQQKYGKSLVQFLSDQGVLDERMLVIHAIWIDAQDIDLLASAGCTVAHNPVCNLRLGSGVMPWQALRAAGVPICLGTDEMNTDDTTNLWQVAKTAALLQTLGDTDDRHWPRAGEFLQAATRGGARAIRRAADLGQLVVGAAADLCLLDLDTHAFTPLNDLRAPARLLRGRQLGTLHHRARRGGVCEWCDRPCGRSRAACRSARADGAAPGRTGRGVRTGRAARARLPCHAGTRRPGAGRHGAPARNMNAAT